MATSKTSRLEAVNSMLMAAGETPISGLTTQGGVDATIADKTLTETERSVQAIGWHFNTRTATFSPDASGFIALPEAVIRIDTDDYGRSQLTLRSGRIYNAVDDTYVFTSAVTLSIVEFLDWLDLPESARQYITKKAARVFVDRTVSDAQMTRLVRQDEMEALATLQRDEMNSGNYRIFGPENIGVVDRGGPMDWVGTSW